MKKFYLLVICLISFAVVLSINSVYGSSIAKIVICKNDPVLCNNSNYTLSYIIVNNAMHTFNLSNCHSSQLIVFNQTNSTFYCNSTPLISNMLVLISDNETDISQTVANSDQVLRTFTLPANTYSKIIVESEIMQTHGALSLPQTISYKIKDNGSIKKTFTSIALAEVGTRSLDLKYIFAENLAHTITITQSGALADGSTSIMSHSFRIYGIQ